MRDDALVSGTIITFYSYKGGTGRSMSLANAAWLLASSGKRVLVIDWDLEAPGLHRYFQPFLIDKDLTSSEGVIDFLINFELEAAAVHPDEKEESDPDWYLAHADITTYAASLDWQFPDGGTLDFIPAGRQDYSYAARLASFNWQNFYERMGGGVFLEEAKRRMRAEYDYVLIDSRTGVSDTAGICTLQLPDILVVCFTLNNQSIEGAAAIAQSVHKQGGEAAGSMFERKLPQIRILPVSMRIDEAEKDKLSMRRDYALRKFEQFPQHIPKENRQKYLLDVQVRYVPYYAYHEVLAVFVDNPGDAIINSSLRLCAHLTGAQLAYDPLPESKQREIRKQFEVMHQAHLGDSYDLFLSFSRQDEAWASQLAARLEQEEWHGRKLRLVSAPWDIAPGENIVGRLEEAVTRSRKIGVVLSPEALEHSWPMLEAAFASQLDTAQQQQKLIPLYLRDSEMPELLKNLRYIDFRDEEQFEFGCRMLLAVIKDEPLPRRVETTSPSVAPSAHIPRPPVSGYIARRDAEGRDLLALLREELSGHGNRLVVLWGPGGVGKTAIAAEVARTLLHDSGARVVWTSAAAREDYTLSILLDESATQLGQPELRLLPLAQKTEQLRALLAEATTLIVLDNFETISLDEQKSCLDFLIQQMPCSVLITSRQKITQARNFTIMALTSSEAESFLDRLIEQTSDPSIFAHLNRQRVVEASGYNPLILQWVVAQIDLAQDPDTVLHELSKGVGDAAQRVFYRSFDLPQLGDDGRNVLLALSLFADSASRPALAEVAGFGGDQARLGMSIKHLAALSLVHSTEAGQRLMLTGLTRELAKARLSKEAVADDFRRRFIQHFDDFTWAHKNLEADDLEALRSEQRNLLYAMDLAEQSGLHRSVTLIARILTNSTTGVLVVSGEWDEALRRGEQAMRAAKVSADEWTAAEFGLYNAELHRTRGNYDEAERLYEEALATFRQLGRQDSVSSALFQLGALAQDRADLEAAHKLYRESLEISRKFGFEDQVATILHRMGMLAHDRGDTEEAERLYQESLKMKETLGEQIGVARALHELGRLAKDKGDNAQAKELYQRSLEISRRYANQLGLAITLHELGRVLKDEGEVKEAERSYNESLDISRRLGFKRSEAVTLHELGRLAQDQGEFQNAEELYLRSLEIKEALSDKIGKAFTLHELGRLAQDEGRELDKAFQYYQQSLALWKPLKHQLGEALTLHELGRLAQDQGRIDEARRYYEESLELKKQIGDELGIAATIHELGRIAHDQREYKNAQKLYLESLQIKKKHNHIAGIANTLDALGRLEQDQGNYAKARTLYNESIEMRLKIGDKIGYHVTRSRLQTLPFEQPQGATAVVPLAVVGEEKPQIQSSPAATKPQT